MHAHTHTPTQLFSSHYMGTLDMVFHPSMLGVCTILARKLIEECGLDVLQLENVMRYSVFPILLLLQMESW